MGRGGCLPGEKEEGMIMGKREDPPVVDESLYPIRAEEELELQLELLRRCQRENARLLALVAVLNEELQGLAASIVLASTVR